MQNTRKWLRCKNEHWPVYLFFDEIQMTVGPDLEEHVVEIPPELTVELKKDKAATTFFDKLFLT